MQLIDHEDRRRAAGDEAGATYNYATVDSIAAVMRTKTDHSIAKTPGAGLHIAAVACEGPYGPGDGLAVTFTCHEGLTAQDGSTAAKRSSEPIQMAR